MDDPRLTLTVAEAAVMLGISKTSAYNAIRQGEIPSITLGGRIVVPKAAFHDMLSRGLYDYVPRGRKSTKNGRQHITFEEGNDDDES